VDILRIIKESNENTDKDYGGKIIRRRKDTKQLFYYGTIKVSVKSKRLYVGRDLTFKGETVTLNRTLSDVSKPAVWSR
jgi:hypothetical protein